MGWGWDYLFIHPSLHPFNKHVCTEYPLRVMKVTKAQPRPLKGKTRTHKLGEKTEAVRVQPGTGSSRESHVQETSRKGFWRRHMRQTPSIGWGAGSLGLGVKVKPRLGAGGTVNCVTLLCEVKAEKPGTQTGTLPLKGGSDSACPESLGSLDSTSQVNRTLTCKSWC